MTFPEVERRISSPEALTAVLRDVKRCVANGTLRQTKPANAPLAIDDVTKVPDEGPWPDYVEAHFEDRRSLTVPLMSLVKVGYRRRPRGIGLFSVTLIREIH